MAGENLIFPTAFSRRLAKEEGQYFPPRELTAMAKRGEIPSETTSDGLTLLKDSAATRKILRRRKR